MNLLHVITRRLRAVFCKEKLDAEMSEELRGHLELQAAENMQRGMSAAEARYAAQRQLGGVEQIKERARDQRGGLWVDQIRQDLRYAVRQLRRSPGFTSVTILTLALGIGANTAIFSLINALILRSLPVADPARLVQFQSLNGDESFSYPSYERFRAGAQTLSGLAMLQRGFDKRALIATGFGGTEAEPVRAQALTGGAFGVLGVTAAVGRTLLPSDDRPDQPEAVTVLSHAYWKSRFGGDPAAVGRTIQIDGVMLTIVGVMRPGFEGFHLGTVIDLWWPMSLYPRFERNPNTPNRLLAEGWEWGLIVGRLHAGTTPVQAAAEMQTIFFRERSDRAAKSPRFTEKERQQFLARTIELVPAGNGFTPLRKQLARPVTILSVVVSLVLLLACANVAGLLLARGAARHRELAVRAALGADRARIVRQLATESLLLAGLGGAAGLLLAGAGTAFLRRYLLSTPHGELDLTPDLRILGFTVLVSVVTGVLFGLAPAVRLSRGALQVTAKAAANGGRSRLNQALVVAQIALSVILLATAGLFVRSLQKLQATDLGFKPERVIRFALEFGRGYDLRQRADVHRRVVEALRALPSVSQATVSGAGLLGGDGFGIRFAVDGYSTQPEEDMRALVVVAGPDFFETLGIPLRAGRGFTAADEMPLPATGPVFPRLVVIGESFARKYFPDQNPIGRTLRFGLNPQQPPLEIIGVAKDVKYRTLRESPQLELYVPYFGGVMHMPMVVQAATTGDPRAIGTEVHALVRRVDSRVAVTELQTMQDLVDFSLLQERMVAHLGGFFGVFALTLACLGLYGVLAYGVAQRTQEIGVRMALGAQSRNVLLLVVGQGVRLALLGAMVGVVVALSLTGFADKFLFGVTPADPVTFVSAVTVLLVVAALAAWLPARRAARVDPMIALRAE